MQKRSMQCRYLAAAMILMLVIPSLVACGKKTEDSGKVALTWAVYSYSVSSEWVDDFNELLERKGLPYYVDVCYVDMPEEQYAKGFDYKEYMQYYLDEVEQGTYDIVGMPALYGYYDFYSTFSQKGLLEPLDSYMEENDTLKSIYPDRIWDALRVEGTVYGFLNTWKNYNQYFVVNENYLNDYGIELEDTVTMDELISVMEQVTAEEQKKGSGRFCSSRGWRPFRANGYEDTLCPMVSIDTTGDELSAKSNLEIPVFQKNMNVLFELTQNGDFNEAFSSDRYQAGSFLMEQVYSYSPEAAVRQMRAGYNIGSEIPLRAVACPEGNNPFYRWGHVTAVSAKSEHKQETIELLCAVYSDQELSEQLAYGTRDKDYQEEDSLIVPLGKASFDPSMQMYFGNDLITAPTSQDSDKKT